MRASSLNSRADAPASLRQLRATRWIDQAIFEIDSDLRVGALEEPLDLAEERFVHRQKRRVAVVVEIEQLVGEPIEREPHFAKTIRQLFIDIVQFAAARGRVRSDELIIGPPDLLVKFQVGRAAPAAMLGVLVKNSAEKKRIIADVRAEQKSLFRRRAGQRDQHIGNVLAPDSSLSVRRTQTVRAGKSFEERADVIAQLAIGDSGLAARRAGRGRKNKNATKSQR